MLTIVEAAKIEPNTEAFEAAVDQMSEVCAAEPENKQAAAVLLFLLQRNSDYCMKAANARS